MYDKWKVVSVGERVLRSAFCDVHACAYYIVL